MVGTSEKINHFLISLLNQKEISVIKTSLEVARLESRTTIEQIEAARREYQAEVEREYLASLTVLDMDF